MKLITGRFPHFRFGSLKITINKTVIILTNWLLSIISILVQITECLFISWNTAFVILITKTLKSQRKDHIEILHKIPKTILKI